MQARGKKLAYVLSKSGAKVRLFFKKISHIKVVKAGYPHRFSKKEKGTYPRKTASYVQFGFVATSIQNLTKMQDRTTES